MTTDTKIIVCPACRALNRIHSGREAEAVCGKCKTKVFEATALELVGPTFDRHITKNDVPMLVDFYSPTCGPCLMMGPQFDDAAKRLHPKARLAKLDTTADQAIAARFNVMAVPTLILFKDGREVARQQGAMNTQDIENWVNNYTN